MTFTNKASEDLFNKTANGTLPDEIAARLEENIAALTTEYLLEGRLSIKSIEPIIGYKQPIIPDSPDMDAMMDAWEEKAAYANLVIIIDNTVRSRAIAAR